MKEKTTSQTVLVAMTGGLESTVAAYLLKKQGYRCIGIGLQLFEQDEVQGPFADIVVNDLNKVKAICSSLDIPFYAVNASEAFAYTVLDPLVGRVLSGQTFEPLVFLNLVLMDTLLAKAKKFNTNLIASGHYAKVLVNHKLGAYELSVANDLESDQSYMLARLEQKHLENLILPLAEIRKKEVQKIGELINVDFIKRTKSNVLNLMHDPRIIPLVQERSSKDLRRTGSLYDYRLESSLGEHVGIHHYYVGKSNLFSKPENPIDPAQMVVSIVPFKGNIFIDFPDHLKHSHALVTRFQSSVPLDVTLPLSVYVKLSSSGEKIPCKLYFKNNKTCLIEFEHERSGLLVPGQFAVFYNRALDKGKVIGSAILEQSGFFLNGELHTLPIYRKESDEEDKKTKQTDKLHF